MTTEETTSDTGVQDNTNATPATEEAPATKETELSGGDDTKTTEDANLMGGDDTKDDSTDEEAKTTGAPEKYEPFTHTKGFEMSEEAHAEISELGKKYGLSQEQLQGLITHDEERQVAERAAQTETNKAQVETWRKEVRKKYGEGYAEAHGKAKDALGKFYGPEITKIFVNAGFTDNPLFFDHLVKLGELISEDSFVKSETQVKGKNEGGLVERYAHLDKSK